MINFRHPDLLRPVFGVDVDVSRDCKDFEVLNKMLQSVRLAHLRVVRKDLLSRCETIHNWHTNVHQNEIVHYFAAPLS